MVDPITAVAADPTAIVMLAIAGLYGGDRGIRAVWSRFKTPEEQVEEAHDYHELAERSTTALEKIAKQGERHEADLTFIRDDIEDRKTRRELIKELRPEIEREIRAKEREILHAEFAADIAPNES